MQNNYLQVNRELLEEFNINGTHRNDRVLRTPESWVNIKNKPTNVLEDEIEERNIPEGMRYYYAELSSQAGGYSEEILEKHMEKGARPVKKNTLAPTLSNLTDDEKNMLAEVKNPNGDFNKDPFRHFHKQHGLLLLSIDSEIYKMYENRSNATAFKSYENLTEEGFNAQPQPYNMYKEINRENQRSAYNGNNSMGRRNNINEGYENIESPFRRMSGGY